MQQLVYNSFGAGTDSVQKQTYLEPEMTRDDEMFNDGDIDSVMMSSDSNDEQHRSSDEFSINFAKRSSQNFGLDYWIKNIDTSLPKPLPCHKSTKSVFSSKSNPYSLSSSLQKPKRPMNNDVMLQNENSNSRTASYDIPRLKIPKHKSKKNSKNKSPLHALKSSSLVSEASLRLPQSEKKTKKSVHKVRPNVVTKDSVCLGKSFEKFDLPRNESKSQIRAASHDVLCLTLAIDSDIYSQFPSLTGDIPGSELNQINNYPHTSDVGSDQRRKERLSSFNRNCHTLPPTEHTSPLSYSKSHDNSLSVSCDIPCKENQIIKKKKEQSSVSGDSIPKKTNDNSRKRSFDQSHDDNKPCTVSPKRRLVDIGPDKDRKVIQVSEEISETGMTPIDFLRFLTNRLKVYESSICEKYCLSQPNAMKFLAQSHGNKWELYKTNVNQMHLVPCEFLNEIFYHALHCFGLERKVLQEIMDGNRSPLRGTTVTSSHCSEYTKIRDEYSLCLKRVRYGIGVIDELFRYKVTNHNTPLHDDMVVVRKWKHIIYYLCLHAKSAFMAKEIQYQHYVQFPINPFDGATEPGANNTPSVRSLSSNSYELSYKPQLPKENCKLYECKDRGKTQSPEHQCQSDLDGSPHSYDSGKGSSIRLSSNPNGRNTSSLSSTPHSHTQPESHLDLPRWSQLYRIDQYQSTANDYVRLLPDAAQLHQRIVARIGTEPNANGRDNILKLIYYSDICQQLCKEDLMPDSLQRLITSVTL